MSSLADDAGRDEEPDAGPRGETDAQSLGYCSRFCTTDACDEGTVCSSPGGFCREGCDATRPACASGMFCDLSERRCVPADGTCEADWDCPIFDGRLNERGVRRCESGRCRFEINPPASSMALTKTASEASIAVHRPNAGERIEDIGAFEFQFDVPAEVMVLSILPRGRIANLADGGRIALWVAYVEAPEAITGVTLSEGGAMIDGKWHAELPQLPTEKLLYFYALGYTRGQLVGQSDLIPFTIGKRLPRPGDVCPGRSNGEFCAAQGALLCVDNICLTACLSDADCASQTLACDYPMSTAQVAARVCR